MTNAVITDEIETTERSTFVVDVRRARRERMAWRAVAVVVVLLAAGPAWQAWHPPAPGSPTAVPLEPGGPVPVAPTGTGDMVHLRPAVQRAVERAIIAADSERVSLRVTLGWRSSVAQQRLYDAALAKYGNAAMARRWMLPPRESQHVTGGAVDVGPPSAATWLEKNGVRYGLCRRYANEPWHFELLAPHKGQPCPSLEPNA